MVDIRTILETDAERMDVLRAVAELGFSDWWIGAGFVRNAVWDYLFGTGKTPLNDVDIAYWKDLGSYGISKEEIISLLAENRENPVWDEENTYTSLVSKQLPGFEFDVKNQARMHVWSNRDIERNSYSNAAEGIADWVETATAIGVRLMNGEIELLTPYGTDDLVKGIIRPTKPELAMRARERAQAKGWLTKWPALTFADSI